MRVAAALVVLSAALLLAPARPARALLCATDDVPAATLLFPFVTAKYAASATATNPVADKTARQTLFTVVNTSSTPHIVHFVLWNDFGFPVLDWDALLTGYDVIAYNLADVIEGTLQPTGGRTYSPVGLAPTAWGPASDRDQLADLPAPKGPGYLDAESPNIFKLCTDPTWSPGFNINPAQAAAHKVPPFIAANVFNGLRRSQVLAESSAYERFPAGYDRDDEWYLHRHKTDPVWGYVTADVVAACGEGHPAQGREYFDRASPEVTGPWNGPLPTGDYRESLPSAFAIPWQEGGYFDEGTFIQIWKETADVVPANGTTEVLARTGYAFYAWDEQDRTLIYNKCEIDGCYRDSSPSQFPFAVQEVSTKELFLPRTVMTFGWMEIVFMGSTGSSAPVPGGYDDPALNGVGAQGWVQARAVASHHGSVELPAVAIGNYLCNRTAIAASPRDGKSRTDLGDVFY